MTVRSGRLIIAHFEGIFGPRAGPMIKADLVDIIARETGITKVQAEAAVNAIVEAL